LKILPHFYLAGIGKITHYFSYNRTNYVDALTSQNFYFGMKFYMFRTVPLPKSSILILLASCQQTCITYTTVVGIVKNLWWWTEELPETCRVSF